MHRTLISLLAGGIILAASGSLLATTYLPTDLKDVARSAGTIVHGRVVAVRAQWTEGRRRIESLVELEVIEAVKGEAGRRLVFRVPGGELGRYRSVMVGAPRFTEGEEVVLFLNGRAPEVPHLVGLGHAVYRVQPDRSTGRLLVTPPLLEGASRTGRVSRGDPQRKRLPLDAFKTEVRAILRGPAAVPRGDAARGAAAPPAAAGVSRR